MVVFPASGFNRHEACDGRLRYWGWGSRTVLRKFAHFLEELLDPRGGECGE